MDTIRTFKHNGRILQIASAKQVETATLPVLDFPVIAPGSGNFSIPSMKLSTEKIVSGESLTLNAQVIGINIAFIFTEILLHDEDSGNYYGPVAREYVLSEKNMETQGKTHPVWDAEINISLNVTPTMRILTDGVNSAFAFMLPMGYGQAGYELEGLFAREGAENRVCLKLNNAGEIATMLLFKEKKGRSIPHALTMKAGDQFGPFVQILTRSGNEYPDWQIARGISTVLTWQESAFHWVKEAPIPGDYLIGLVVEDLDGAQTRQYIPFTVIK